MLFLDLWFWQFAAIAVAVYLLCPQRLKVAWLLIASAVFQVHFAGPAGAAPVLVFALLTYAAPLLTPRQRGPSPAVAVITLLVGALTFYKYAAFLRDSAASLLQLVGVSLPHAVTAWHAPAIPLGISFFTFEFIHYLYEVHAHGRAPIRHPGQFAVFAIFFPTLAAGPIKRFPDFVPQLETPRNPDWAMWCDGVRRVILGLFRKVCIADTLADVATAMEATRVFTGPLVISLAVVQGLRIYHDFGGYSDIAIGLAKLLGLRVPENFNYPYRSTSLQEFWRRWHISLSSWIRDYVYIPLGGNRRHRTFNLLLAMVLCGLWHGAAWNFAAWGLYHGAGLAAEGLVRHWRPRLFEPGRATQLLGRAFCYSFVSLGWLLFFYPLDTVGQMLVGLARWSW
ncbi:MAG: MBOAT family O-acyltransferase [bacterium]